MPFTPFGFATPGGAAGGALSGTYPNPGPGQLMSEPLPTDFGWLAWSADPGAEGSTFTMVGGTVYFVELFLRVAATVSNLVIQVTTAGVTLTAGQNFAGLFDSGGVQRAITADQSTNWQSTGAQVMPFTSPFAAPAGRYWAALLANGTTPPVLRSSAASVGLGNAGLAAGNLRFAVAGTLLTALPASVTPASLVATGAASLGILAS